MSIVQLKCSNTRPRRSEDLTDSQLRIPLRKNSVQALAQIFASYQHQNRSQQPNGTQSPPLNRLSQKHSPSPPNFAVPVHDPNSKANQKSVNANQQQQPQQPSTPPQPRLVRIAIIGSDSALHNVVTGYPVNYDKNGCCGYILIFSDMSPFAASSHYCLVDWTFDSTSSLSRVHHHSRLPPHSQVHLTPQPPLITLPRLLPSIQ